MIPHKTHAQTHAHTTPGDCSVCPEYGPVGFPSDHSLLANLTAIKQQDTVILLQCDPSCRHCVTSCRLVTLISAGNKSYTTDLSLQALVVVFQSVKRVLQPLVLLVLLS